MANKGYYTIIQYIPDQGRLESVNIGVVLVIPDLEYVGVSSGYPNSYHRAHAFFPDVDLSWLSTAMDSLTNRIRITSPTKLEFGSLINTRANELRMTPLRAMKVIEKPSEALKKLKAELVDV